MIKAAVTKSESVDINPNSHGMKGLKETSRDLLLQLPCPYGGHLRQIVVLPSFTDFWHGHPTIHASIYHLLS